MSDYLNATLACDGKHFFIEGPAGQLESMASCVSGSQKPSIVIICHPHPQHGGSMQNKVVHTLDKSFQKLGASTLRFNFRSVGESEGEYADAIGEVDDLAAIIAWVERLKPGHEIYLAGFSFGAYIVMQSLQAFNPSQVVIVAPPVDMFDFSQVSSPNCPCLLIQGESDEIVDSEQVQRWAQSLEGINSVLVPDCGHFFHGKLNILQSVLVDNLQI